MLRIVTENRILYYSLVYLTGFYMWSPLDTNRKCIPGVVCVTCPTVCVGPETDWQGPGCQLAPDISAPHGRAGKQSREFHFRLFSILPWLGLAMPDDVWLRIKYISYSRSSVRV